MSNCSNCFNGCAEIVSDKCVKYTGLSIPTLGIENGDTLSHVEEALSTFLISALNGTGVKPTIDPNIICEVVSKYLNTYEEVNSTNLFSSLIKAACDLQEQVTALLESVDEIESPYLTGCLEGVNDQSNTHDVVQATINKLCQVDANLALLAINVDVNYVKLADLNTLIQQYLDSGAVTTEQQYLKMVPYTVVEYYPPNNDLSNFDPTGKGYVNLGWDKVYLCNGNNGTPDKRGRSPIGSTDLQGGSALSSTVSPAFGNPAYNGTKVNNGENKVTLDVTQIPVHSHTATVTVNDPGHFHSISQQSNSEEGSGKVTVGGQSPEGANPVTNSATTGISVNVTNANAGSGQSHNNVHPVISCYYIMYIP